MPAEEDRSDPERSGPIPAAVAALLVVLYAFGVLGHDLWTPDEPRVASISRQVAEGAWVVPTLNGEPFLEQPPLAYWCFALLYRAFGYDPPEISRVASALFGLGGLAATGLLAAHLARARGRGAARRVGALAALSLGLSLEHLSTAHRVVVDGALAFFTTASAYAYLRGLTTSSRGAGLGWFAGGHALASLAFLAKGAIGLAAPGLWLLALVIAERRPRRLLEARLWLAPLCFLGVAGPWLWLLYRETGADGLHAIFVTNTLGRALPIGGAVQGHLRPIYFYFLYLPLHLLPATLFVAGGALRRLQCRARSDTPARLDAPERFALDAAFLWLGLGFALLSLAATKRPIYLLPFFPAAAVVGGFWLEAFFRREADGRYERAIGRGLAVLLGLVALAVPVAAGALGADISLAVVGALLAGGVAAFSWRAAVRQERDRALYLWGAGLAIALLTTVETVVPAIDAQKSLRSVSLRISALVPPEQAIYALHPDETTEGMLPFYAGRPIVDVPTKEDVEPLVARLREVYLLVLEKGSRAREAPSRAPADAPPPAEGAPQEPAKTPRSAPPLRPHERLPHEVLLDNSGRGPGVRAYRLLRFRSS